jgi:ribosomal protein S18 acetylase RimI-like enzyme
MQIRAYQPADLDAVLRLNVESLQPVRDIPVVSASYTDLHQIETAYGPPGCFLVGEVDGEIMAMGALRVEDAATFEVKRVRIAVGHQRRGYGARLMAALEANAVAAGVRRVVLETTIQQTAAQRLYEALSYRETGRHRVENARGVFDVIAYEKLLG